MNAAREKTESMDDRSVEPQLHRGRVLRRTVRILATRLVLVALVVLGVGSGITTGSHAAEKARPAISPPVAGEVGPDAADVVPALCASSARPAILTVRRVVAFPQNHIRFSFAAVVTVKSAARAHAAAAALCGLPAMPAGTHMCPADLGVSYRLSFSSSTRDYPLVTVHAGGCEVVTGLGVTRWIAQSPGFWHTLGLSMGMAKASAATFAGAM